MGFTLGVQNTPSPATLWMALLAAGEGPNMTEPLPLSERWACSEPAPGPNYMDIACFDPEEYLVQENLGYVTIEDGKNYTFDFATETLLVAAPSIWETMGPILGLGLMAGMVGMMVPAVKKGFD